MMGYLARIVIFVYLATFSAITFADEPPRFSDIRSPGILRGGSADLAKTSLDTCILIGPLELAPVVIGTFQDAAGDPDWHGWTTQDWAAPDTTDTTWHVSDYYAFSGTYSAYCGDETIPSCGGGDPTGGYGNKWEKALKWGMAVADPSQPTTIEVAFAFDVDSEYNYDYAVTARELANKAWENLWLLSGDTTGTVTIPVSYAAGEYFGDGLDEIGVWFLGTSDGGWSDEDCDAPSTGIWRLDDVTITSNNPSTVVHHDFEDGTLGPFERVFQNAVGDFAQLGYSLDDPDICVDNHSPQVVFLDDGIIQPATGGSYATSDNRRYANNFVVNYTGGLSFNGQNHLRNVVLSPAIPWQDPSHDRLRFGFGYMTDSFYMSGEAGVWMEWLIRSTDGDAASLENAPWQHSPYVYQGGPHYGRRFWEVTDDVVDGRTFVQVALGATEIGYVWGLDGTNGSPSPYYDNVRLESMAATGPSLSIQVSGLAQDAFPEIGTVDTVDLGRNHIRFDMARNISPLQHEHIHHGDSLTVDAQGSRTGAGLTGRPRMHYKLLRNNLFDPYRTSGFPDSGVVVMDTAFTPTGTPVWGRFRVDLPDTGFLFPGDVLHYYFEAEDAIGGPGGTAPMIAYLPADLTGFGDFVTEFAWSHDFTVRGLPTVKNASWPPGSSYGNPPTLYWDDSESEGAGTRQDWVTNFHWLGNVSGNHFDYYYSKSPGSSDDTGLAGRATADLLELYDNIVYFSGDVTTSTLSNGDWSVGGANDVVLLENWLDTGSKNLFLSGNRLISDLAQSGSDPGDFLNYRMMLDLAVGNFRDVLEGQLAPRVLVTPSNPVLYLCNSWIMDGGCPDLRTFSLAIPSGAVRLAVFANPSGVDGGYPYAPMARAIHGNGSQVVSMTMDLSSVARDPYEENSPGSWPPIASRILRSVIIYFGEYAPGPQPPGVMPQAGVFAAANYPNPFNPVTEIAYSVKTPGHLTLKVYNLRGAVVRTLLDRHVTEAGKVTWDGTDSHGGKISSGVYFYEARMGDEVRVGKMTLVK
ncbi:MAG: T9SS type A sorting domain-containing protein [bacterium]|nr:T9SS type A sorting domain-containing protein [bacterium]